MPCSCTTSFYIRINYLLLLHSGTEIPEVSMKGIFLNGSTYLVLSWKYFNFLQILSFRKLKITHLTNFNMSNLVCVSPTNLNLLHWTKLDENNFHFVHTLKDMTISFAALHQQMDKAFKLGIRNCFIIMRTIDGIFSLLISRMY